MVQKGSRRHLPSRSAFLPKSQEAEKDPPAPRYDLKIETELYEYLISSRNYDADAINRFIAETLSKQLRWEQTRRYKIWRRVKAGFSWMVQQLQRGYAWLRARRVRDESGA